MGCPCTPPPAHSRESGDELSHYLRVFFFQLIPSIFLGILGLVFSEAARLLNCNAAPRQVAISTRVKCPGALVSRLSRLSSPPPLPCSHFHADAGKDCTIMKNVNAVSPPEASAAVGLVVDVPSTAEYHVASSRLGGSGGCDATRVAQSADAFAGQRVKREPKLWNPSSLVTTRVDAYENFVAAAEIDQGAILEPPEPLDPVYACTPISSSTHASDIVQSSSSRHVLASNLQKALAGIEDVNSEPGDVSSCTAGDLSRTALSAKAQENLVVGATTSGPIDSRQLVGGTESREEAETYNESCDASPESCTIMPGVSQINVKEAPLGVESLQELIPEVIPGVMPSQSSRVVPEADSVVDLQLFRPAVDEMPEISLDDDDIIDVESMENVPILDLHNTESSTSWKTESYSSPKSPAATSPIQQTLLESRHPGSWRASDHDLFSEDPMTGCDDVALGVTPKENSKSKSHRSSDSPANTSRLGSLLEGEYDSVRMKARARNVLHSNISASSSENDLTISMATPVTSNKDFGSWRRRLVEMDVSSSRTRTSEDSRSSRKFSGNFLFRHAGVELTGMRDTTMSDRPRPGFVESARAKSRFTPSMLSSKIPLSSIGGPPAASAKVGRSISHIDARFEDWPEYRPSNDKSGRISRRHVSDMTFGVKARKRDLLPFHLLTGERCVDELDGAKIPERFGGNGKGWMRRLGISGAPKEGSEAKGGIRNILRRRKKVAVLDNPPDAETPFVEDLDRNAETVVRLTELTAHRSGSGDKDFKFEAKLNQETVFSLLNRICPDNGFRIVVRKPIHKMKIQIPCVGEGGPLLASIILTRLPQNRGTSVSIARSKEDISYGRNKDIEVAGVILRKRLDGHVEFIDDSFASVYTEDPPVHKHTKRTRNAVGSRGS